MITMIVHRDVEQPARRHQLLRHHPVVRRRRRIAARMVVHQDDRRRPLGDRLAEYLPRMHQRGIEYASRHRHVALQPMLRVQHGHVKLFHREILQSRRKGRIHIARGAQRRPLIPRLDRQTPSELECRMNGHCTRRPDTDQRRQRRHRFGGQSP